ncbi:MAG: helix-turn-helix domain-containing protein [Candidatus Electrothrix scaldis]|nr:MAG: helix-turn-helix domain-containing protein [Candidatus Electrothrix sp. GW3-3]
MFEDIWERIKKETDIQQLKDLADVVGTAQQSVSRKRKEDKFPIEWAYIVGKQYNLSTDWIIEGKGPKKRDGQIKRIEVDNNYLSLVVTWFKDITLQDPRKKTWFEIQFEKAFPEFKDWLEIREEEREQKVA